MVVEDLGLYGVVGVVDGLDFYGVVDDFDSSEDFVGDLGSVFSFSFFEDLLPILYFK